MGTGRLGAFGQAGLPGVAWMRMGDWVLLDPGRGRRDGGGEGRVGWGWVLGRVVRHGPFGRLRAGFSKDYRPAHHERLGGLGVGCPEEAGWKPAPTQDRGCGRRDERRGQGAGGLC